MMDSFLEHADYGGAEAHKGNHSFLSEEYNSCKVETDIGMIAS